MTTIDNLKKEFRIIKWNASASLLTEKDAKTIGIDQDHYYKAGEIIYGLENTFSVDILFAAQKPGFVVQYITRQIYNKETAKMTHNDGYWEIFYIDSDNEIIIDGITYYTAHNPDAFKLGPEGKHLNNAILAQTGVASFYPYNDEHNIINYTKKDTMKYNKELGIITGWNQSNFGKEKELGGGLPFSNTDAPLMRGLDPLPFQIRHIVRSSWNSNEVDGIPIAPQLIDELIIYENTDGIPIGNPFTLDRQDTDYLSPAELLEIGSKLRKYAIDNKIINSEDIITPELAKDIIVHISSAHFTHGGSKKLKSIKTKKSKKTRRSKTKKRQKQKCKNIKTNF